jgi:phosphoesterase RecJ-like protein
MIISDSAIKEFTNAIKKAKHVGIISHKNPDPDTLSSNIALRKILETYKKKVSSICKDPIPKKMLFITDKYDFKTDIDKSMDLLICVDTSSRDQTHFLLKSTKKNIIVIDHHASNEMFGKINLVNPDAASTTYVLYFLFIKMPVTITSDIATLLLTGLYYDTGNFMHSNTNSTVLMIAADLQSKGANRKQIVEMMNKAHSVNQLKLWGKALSNITLTKTGGAVSGLTKDDFMECNATQEDTKGIIDYISSAKDTKYAALFCNDSDGNIKGSFRSKEENVDVADLAKYLGGGGHKKASGFSIKGKIKRDTYWSITKN